ncbi:MAG: hypothetical protein ACRDRX_06560 [Pseudonocardiaceae bacterium]
MADDRGDAIPTFGKIARDQVIYNVHRGWFRSGPPEAISLRHVTHVELRTRRHPVLGVLLLIAALACRAIGPIGLLVAIVPLAAAILLLWGSPLLLVHTADGRSRPARGLPWTRPEAEWFESAVNHRRKVDTAQADITAGRPSLSRPGARTLPTISSAS